MPSRSRALVISDALGDGFGPILMQNKEGKLKEKEGGFLIIQVGSATLKAAWKNYSAIELKATWVI